MARGVVTLERWQQLQRRNWWVLAASLAATAMWSGIALYEPTLFTITVLGVITACALFMAGLIASMRRARRHAVQAHDAAIDRGDSPHDPTRSAPRPPVDDPS